MFTIIISEKGGAERRESFEKNEINVGRVQGNDLMLPKGNVSKHHARLLLRDGRFIVTDLKSTNGTYVNGRKIAQATIVREGDKIYIGDFVLRLDLASHVSSGGPDAQTRDEPIPNLVRSGGNNTGRAPSAPSYPSASMTNSARHDAVPMDGDEHTAGPIVMVPSVPSAPMTTSSRAIPSGPVPRPSVSASSAPANPTVPATGMHHGTNPPAHEYHPASRAPAGMPSHAPSVHGSPAVHSAPPAAVHAPPSAAVHAVPPPAVSPPSVSPAPSPASLPAPTASAPPPKAAPSVVPSLRIGAPNGASATGGGASLSVPVGPPAIIQVDARPLSKIPPKESPAHAARRLAMVTLLDRVAERMDLRSLRESVSVDPSLAVAVERAVREQARAMAEEGELPGGLEVDQVARDAAQELVGLGPVFELMGDDEVAEIHCVRYDLVMAMRGGTWSLADVSFSSEAALRTVIRRLMAETGEGPAADEGIVECRLPRGARVTAFFPPLASHVSLVVRKRRSVDGAIEEFIRTGALSRPMSVFLEQVMAGRANLFISGTRSPYSMAFLGALAAMAPVVDRMGALHLDDETMALPAGAVSFSVPSDPAKAVHLAGSVARFRFDRLFVVPLQSSVALPVLDAIAGGSHGVVAYLPALSLAQGLRRAVDQVLLARPGLSVHSARECIASSFDIAVDLGETSDGRLRVIRIAEIDGWDDKGIVTRDIFVAGNVDGESGAHAASGVVPKVAEALASRGFRLDPNLFRKSATARAG